MPNSNCFAIFLSVKLVTTWTACLFCIFVNFVSSAKDESAVKILMGLFRFIRFPGWYLHALPSNGTQNLIVFSLVMDAPLFCKGIRMWLHMCNVDCNTDQIAYGCRHCSTSDCTIHGVMLATPSAESIEPLAPGKCRDPITDQRRQRHRKHAKTDSKPHLANMVYRSTANTATR